MTKRIAIHDISNGFLVEFYTGDSVDPDSKTEYYPTWKEALEAIIKWATSHALPKYFSPVDSS